MTEQTSSFDYSKTLFLPQTDFPMKAGLPQKEPEWVAHWDNTNLYKQMRQNAKGRKKFLLHDGPPYANGNIHIGHALNKILKDIVVRSQGFLGFDAPYVPGWDCHGLPIEWKIEEQYRAKGQNKDQVPILEFRNECRQFAKKWIDIQKEEFKRLGIMGEWETPYTTMNFKAEASIANEVLKFATSGQLYRGSKPVMWSVVEKTALAEAEIEYQDKVSTTIWVKFFNAELGAHVIIWTTTPWTIPANRAIAYSKTISYGLYEVTQAPQDNWLKVGEKIIIADNLAQDVMNNAKVEAFKKLETINPANLSACVHPFAGLEGSQGYYDFQVPLLPAEYVTDDTGTGFVHTAPGHGADDFITYLNNKAIFEKCGTDKVPETVAADGVYFPHVALFSGAYVYDQKGKEGDANKRVIEKLIEANALIARGKITHPYPHSWRSKAPVIFRNTPQWFIAMDKAIDGSEDTLRTRALNAISDVKWFPQSGERRLRGMVEGRPDWVISRQRAWGVPIAVFVHKQTGDVLKDDALNAKIIAAFHEEGADVWFAQDPLHFLQGTNHNPNDYEAVVDILDVWFESGCTHKFVLDDNTWDDLSWPATLYLEGSDQHRGWFQSSLLESCGTRKKAPYEQVLTHGFVLDEKGEKMSKSVGNVVSPQDVMKTAGADILRLWVAASDYSDDLRIGQEIIKTFSETYRKIRNTIRWMLGSLSHKQSQVEIPYDQLPPLEQYVLHRLFELNAIVHQCYETYDFKRITAALSQFLNSDLSAFYFDIRKDALYCDAPSSLRRNAALQVIEKVMEATLVWLAPILPFTMEEAWQAFGAKDTTSIHLKVFPTIPLEWQNQSLAEDWEKIRDVRKVVTGALELKRANKDIGSSLEAAPIVYINDQNLFDLLAKHDLADICITSDIHIKLGLPKSEAFTLQEVENIAVEFQRAEGKKCARSWRITQDVGSDEHFPDISARDAKAMREWCELNGEKLAC